MKHCDLYIGKINVENSELPNSVLIFSTSRYYQNIHMPGGKLPFKNVNMLLKMNQWGS